MHKTMEEKKNIHRRLFFAVCNWKKLKLQKNGKKEACRRYFCILHKFKRQKTIKFSFLAGISEKNILTIHPVL